MMSKPGTTGRSAPDFNGANRHLPAAIADDEKAVESSFWRKVLRVFAKLPFIDDLLAAYFCATDSATPLRVRGILLGALAYFVLPTDVIPDFIAGLGFTDDATVLAAAIGLVARHISPAHRKKAADMLKRMRDNAGTE